MCCYSQGWVSQFHDEIFKSTETRSKAPPWGRLVRRPTSWDSLPRGPNQVNKIHLKSISSVSNYYFILSCLSLIRIFQPTRSWASFKAPSETLWPPTITLMITKLTLVPALTRTPKLPVPTLPAALVFSQSTTATLPRQAAPWFKIPRLSRRRRRRRGKRFWRALPRRARTSWKLAAIRWTKRLKRTFRALFSFA